MPDSWSKFDDILYSDCIYLKDESIDTDDIISGKDIIFPIIPIKKI